MNKPIPRNLIYWVIDQTIKSLDKLKDEILSDKAHFATMYSGIIPINPEGGYTTLLFVYNDLEIGNQFDKEIIPILRKYNKLGAPS